MQLKKNSFTGRSGLLAAASVLTVLVCQPPAAMAETGPAREVVAFSIPEQPLSQAIAAFSRQSRINVLVPSSVTAGRTSRAVAGEMTPDAALEALLEGSALDIRRQKDGAYLVSQETSEPGVPEGEESYQIDRLPSRAGEAGGNGKKEDPSSEERRLGQITVTGTNIRGTAPVGVPLTVLNKAEIEQSGATDITQVFQRLPQNFGGGITEQTQSGAGGGGGATVFGVGGSGINLRGLGNNASLTLVNGRRFAATGIGNYFDINSIPLAAVSRIEILTDGASALYGADAVGGVVNIVLLDDYDGAATSVRYGGATQGGVEEFAAGQTLGRRWRNGGVLGSVEYRKRDPLFADQREFTQSSDDPRGILPEHEGWSGYVSFDQKLSARTEVFSSLFYSDRASQLLQPAGASIAVTQGDSEQISGNAGVRFGLSETWKAEVSGSASQNTSVTSVNQPGASLSYEVVSQGFSVDLRADGALFDLPGGTARLAVAGQARLEDLNDKVGFLSTGPYSADRDVLSASTELYLPLVTAQNRRAGVESLEISGALRLERYSDFGNSLNPKLSLGYSPAPGLQLRGSYGRSFIAPLLFQLNDKATINLLLQGPDPLSSTGTSIFLQKIGSNSQLDAEEATTWSSGFDYSAPFLEGLTARATYYNVEFRNRIDVPAGAIATGALLQPDLAAFVTRGITPQQISQVISTGRLVNFTGLSRDDALNSVVALLDTRSTNVAAVKTDGIDFELAYSAKPSFGTVSAFVSGTYILNFTEQAFDAAPEISVLNTRYNPIDLQLRGGLTMASGGFEGGVFVNYKDSYRNPFVTPQVGVDSDTTFDASAGYTFAPDQPVLSGTTLRLSVLNVFDAAPPFVQNPLGFNFDGANGNATGRYVSVSLTRKW